MRELFFPTTFYGNGDIIRKYCRFTTLLPLPILLQHGWNIKPTNHDAVTDAPENWYWNEKLRELYTTSFPQLSTRAVGAPFLYLLELLKYRELPIDTRKGSIVFPSHSSALCEMNCDFQEYATILEQLPEEYKPITVCLYHIDQEKGFDKIFLDRGFSITSNGKGIHDKYFLYNFIENTKNKRFAFSNQMTSALLYASVMGLTSYFLGPKFFINITDPEYYQSNYNDSLREWEQNCQQYFIFPNCDRTRQKMFAEQELGKDIMLNPIQMQRSLWNLTLHPKFLRPILMRTFLKTPILFFKKLIIQRKG